MSDTLNEAVSLLNNLLTLARTTTSVVDQGRLDAAVAALADTSLDEVEAFTVRLADEARAASEAATAAADQMAANVVAAEAAAAQAEVQEEEDQAQREERQAAGVS